MSYLDTGLASTYFSEADQLIVPPTASPNSLPPPPTTPQRPTRRYKTQLRDFLSTCRSKRKLQQQQTHQQPPNMTQVSTFDPFHCERLQLKINETIMFLRSIHQLQLSNTFPIQV